MSVFQKNDGLGVKIVKNYNEKGTKYKNLSRNHPFDGKYDFP